MHVELYHTTIELKKIFRKEKTAAAEYAVEQKSIFLGKIVFSVLYLQLKIFAYIFVLISYDY